MLTYADCDVLGSCKKPVNQDAHKGGVEAKLNFKVCEFRIGHPLRNDYGTDGDSCQRGKQRYSQEPYDVNAACLPATRSPSSHCRL